MDKIMHDKLLVTNGNIITPYRLVPNANLLIANGKIAGVYGILSEIRDSTGVDPKDCFRLDAAGDYISPGFIDIHVHGGGGHDFMDGTVDAYLGAAHAHREHGTTAMFPTTLASTNEELLETLKVYGEADSLNQNGARFLGLHLEGPYFSMEQRGAQDPRYIRNPEPSEYNAILEWCDNAACAEHTARAAHTARTAHTAHIARWSIAPELPGALELGRRLKARGILPSIAHSDAVYEQVIEAFEHGYTHVTHLYSGTSMVKRINAFRYAGIVESAFLMDDMTVEIIADGVHLPASLLKLIYKIKGASRIALITDSIRAAGLPDGETVIGSLKDGRKVIVEDGVAKLPDRSAFAGSVATADRLVRTMVRIAEVPIVDAVRMMTLTPAAIMGVDDRKGSLAPGRDADVVIFDKDINIRKVIVGGELC